MTNHLTRTKLHHRWNIKQVSELPLKQHWSIYTLSSKSTWCDAETDHVDQQRATTQPTISPATSAPPSAWVRNNYRAAAERAMQFQCPVKAEPGVTNEWTAQLVIVVVTSMQKRDHNEPEKGGGGVTLRRRGVNKRLDKYFINVFTITTKSSR